MVCISGNEEDADESVNSDEYSKDVPVTGEVSDTEIMQTTVNTNEADSAEEVHCEEP